MKKIKGFTTTELIVVIAVISIISVAAYARLGDIYFFKKVNVVDSLSSMLKVAQKKAISQRRNIYIIKNGDNINLCYVNTNPCPLVQRLFINNEEYVLDIKDILVTLPANLNFNMAGVASSSNIVIPVNDKNITIYAQTGYIRND